MEVPSRLAYFLVSEDELPPEFLQVNKDSVGFNSGLRFFAACFHEGCYSIKTTTHISPHSGTHYVDQVGL